MCTEKLFVITNPLDCKIDLITENELNKESAALKEVFGVSFVDDLKQKIDSDQKFKESIMNTYRLVNEKDTFECLVRLASMEDLMVLLDIHVNELFQKGTEETFKSPYPSKIELEEGIFAWNTEEGYYQEA